MDKRPAQTAHAASGIVSLVFFLSTVPLLPSIPPFGSTQNEIADFYSTYVTRGYLYQFIAGLGLLAALWFFGYLYTRFRQENPASPLPVVMITSATVWVAIDVVYLGLFQIFPVWAQQPETYPILRAFSDAYVLGFMFSVVPAAVAVAAASMCARPSAGWPGWLRPLAVVVVAVQVLGCVPLIEPNSPVKAGDLITYASVFVVIVWICAASIAAIRSERSREVKTRETYTAA